MSLYISSFSAEEDCIEVGLLLQHPMPVTSPKIVQCHYEILFLLRKINEDLSVSVNVQQTVKAGN